MVPVPVFPSPAAIVLHPAIGNPMPMPARTDLVPVYPDIMAAAPVPVPGRPCPPWLHGRDGFVARRRRRNPHIDICGSGGCERGGNRAGGKAQGDHCIALVHSAILADFDNESFA